MLLTMKSLPGRSSRRSVDALTLQRLPERAIIVSAILWGSSSRWGSISTSAKLPSSSPSTLRISVMIWRANTALPAPIKVILGIVLLRSHISHCRGCDLAACCTAGTAHDQRGRHHLDDRRTLGMVDALDELAHGQLAQ